MITTCEAARHAPTDAVAPNAPTCPGPRGGWRDLGRAALVAAAALVVQPATAQDNGLSGPAWTFADRAYRAYEAKQYQEAVAAAREAVALRPDLPRLRVLLVNSLAAADGLPAAVAAAEEAIAAGVVNDELRELRNRLKAQVMPAPEPAAPPSEAYKAADEGYKAYARRNYRAAVESARRAVELEADNRAYRLLLVTSLVAAARLAEAESAAGQALARWPGDAELRLQRGHIRQRLGRHRAAMDDLSAVLRGRGLTVEQVRGARLALADAALSAKAPARALQALEPLARERSYDVAARRGFAFQALGRHADALGSFEAALPLAHRPEQRAAMVRGAVAALVALGRADEARERFATALAKGLLWSLTDTEIAYLALDVRDDETAYRYFRRADDRGQLRGSALLDAAYVARRRFGNRLAESLFRRAIDAQGAGRIALSPQRLLETRRDVTNVSRVWGAYASLIQGPIGIASSGLPGPAGAGRTLQTGAEVYWRPPGIGYRNGATVELFARSFMTLRDSTGSATGKDTVQGSAGVRWKPLADENLILEASRLFPVGRFSRHDWLLRVGYSTTEGGDLRLDVTDWAYRQVYAELNRFTEIRQTLASAEGRIGRAFRLPGDRMVVMAFAAVAAAYDSLLPTAEAYGAGGGLSLRHWFREDQYSGPASYVELAAQYRVRLAGDKRAEGVFAGVLVSY